jgi:hypothetical protein
MEASALVLQASGANGDPGNSPVVRAAPT